jgi:hypothetical protein
MTPPSIRLGQAAENGVWERRSPVFDARGAPWLNAGYAGVGLCRVSLPIHAAASINLGSLMRS